MVLFSRPFVMRQPAEPCHVLHPWTSSCFLSFLDVAFASFRGSCKFFFLVYVLPSLMKGDLSHEHLKEQLIVWVRSCMFGSCNGGVAMYLLCIFRNVLGKYYVPTLGFLPGALGGVGIFAETPYHRATTLTLFIALVSNLYLKILCDEGHLTMTRTKELLLFASGSSLLLYYLRKFPKSYSVLWPFVPHKLHEDPALRGVCPHKENCVDHVSKSVKKYFCFALALQCVKLVLLNLKKMFSGPGTFLKLIFDINNMRLPLFAGLYIGVLQSVSCLMLHLRGKDEAWHALVAGGLASFTFLLQPNTSLSLIACSNLVQIMCRRYVRRKMPDWPWEQMIYMVLMGLMFHARAASPHNFPNYMYYIMDTITSRRSNRIYGVVDSHIITRL